MDAAVVHHQDTPWTRVRVREWHDVILQKLDKTCTIDRTFNDVICNNAIKGDDGNNGVPRPTHETLPCYAAHPFP